MEKPPKDEVNVKEVGGNSSNSPVLQPDPTTQNEAANPCGTKTVTVLEPKTRSRRKSTGPRTEIGKQRTSRNSQKHGIFSKGLLVGDESRREFALLLEGLLQDLKPEGTLETVLVENLAMILWRKMRVMRAESAEIGEAIKYSVLDTTTGLVREQWDCARSGETTGGMLRHRENPRVLREVVEMLRVVRFVIEVSGFRKDPWLLRKIYGLDHGGAAPFGTPFQIYLHMSEEAAQHERGDAGSESIENLKAKMFETLDQEIKRIEALAEDALRFKIERNQFKEIAALVPPPAVSERLLRYETHLSREFDRTLLQLERLQRMRLGQPVIPPINVCVS